VVFLYYPAKKRNSLTTIIYKKEITAKTTYNNTNRNENKKVLKFAKGFPTDFVNLFELIFGLRIFDISTYIVPESCSSIREAFLTTEGFWKRHFKISLSISELPNCVLRSSFEQTRKIVFVFHSVFVFSIFL